MVDEKQEKGGEEEIPKNSDENPKDGEPKQPGEGEAGQGTDASASSEDNGEPEKPKNSLITNAEAVATRIEKANERLERNLKRFEEVQAEAILAGRSHGGGAHKETEDEKWAREAKERYAGTGMDPTPHDGTPTKYS